MATIGLPYAHRSSSPTSAKRTVDPRDVSQLRVSERVGFEKTPFQFERNPTHGCALVYNSHSGLLTRSPSNCSLHRGRETYDSTDTVSCAVPEQMSLDGTGVHEYWGRCHNTVRLRQSCHIPGKRRR